jgi:kynurenine formamidase
MTVTHRVNHAYGPCQVSIVVMSSHIGTHVDAPLHYIPGGKTTEEIDLAAYCGQAVCIDVEDSWVRDREAIFDIGQALEENKELFQPGDKVLLHTGGDKYLGSQDFFDVPDFAGNTGELLEKYGLTGIGFDSPTIATKNAEQQHQEVLKRGMGIYDCLVYLSPFVGKRFFFSAVPLKFEGGDGSPTRAYAIL